MTTWLVTTAIVTPFGPLAGLLWANTIPKVTYVIIQGEPLIADPEGEGPVGIDGRFALIGLAAGLLCGIAAYAARGRRNDIALILGIAAGGVAASLLAWKTGHLVGLGHFDDVVRHGRDGDTVTGIADLRAKGVLVFWPVAAVAAYGLLEVLVRRLPPGDRGDGGAGEGDEVGGDELDLESAPTGRDVDGREG
ncbi:hypothetical protein J4557_32340 [Actinomadura nitritigenes]|uniref:ABC transporter permease n=1 Tax=Actinomadura nitritigenes TaxID=134602 RepID=A0ABS3R7L6_9ACTN|nr:hypothetical protein [Actinomadura nitritigenes]